MGKCRDCSGTGHCSHCVQGKVECFECGGSGRDVCEVCRGNNEYCSACHGTGWVDCEYCHGSRVVDCSFCDGSMRCHLCGGSGKE